MVNGGMTFHDVLFAIFVEGYGTVFYVGNPRLHIQVTNRGGHVESSQIDVIPNDKAQLGIVYFWACLFIIYICIYCIILSYRSYMTGLFEVV